MEAYDGIGCWLGARLRISLETKEYANWSFLRTISNLKSQFLDRNLEKDKEEENKKSK